MNRPPHPDPLPRLAGARKWLVWWVGMGLVAATGCSGPTPPTPPAYPARSGGTRPEELAQALRLLAPTVEATEADRAATCAYAAARELAREYRVVRPAILHNMLVNMGVRDRGLCYHWADDLEARLRALDLKSLELHRGVAGLGTYREHSSVVLTAVGQPFEEGIVLDAWRRGGKLFWLGVKKDRYQWIRVRVVVPPGGPPSSAGGEGT